MRPQVGGQQVPLFDFRSRSVRSFFLGSVNTTRGHGAVPKKMPGGAMREVWLFQMSDDQLGMAVCHEKTGT